MVIDSSKPIKVSRLEKANALRALSMDAVQKANSGHPGMPMGMADIAEVIWTDFLRFNPSNPNWFDRDRFLLSNGHGSMLHYALLHLVGYDLSMDELENFRQLHSRTPGHPEYGDTPGIETTTGPLGQGIANGVGLALAEKILADRFNRDKYDIVNHYTWVLLGDGCLMEGISHEACSLAGTLGLGKLIVLWDDNGISIDGKVEGWFTDDTAARFRAYDWQVIEGIDGHDSDSIVMAIEEARADQIRPSLICCRTKIGWGSPNKQGTEMAHGAPLGVDEIRLVRETIGWPHPAFNIPNDIYDAWDSTERGAVLESKWNEHYSLYKGDYPDVAFELDRRMVADLPSDWDTRASVFLDTVKEEKATVASRKASQQTLEGLAPLLPELIGGSADLTGSNLTTWSGTRPVTNAQGDGNYIYYGVREFGMSAITNGLALHGGFIPFCATFLTFSDYSRNALRMSALMNIRSIFVFTHDSVGLGEDGPTHQPVEHTESLRLIPNMSVWRPCDSLETAVAWKYAIEREDGPTCLLLSRQDLTYQERTPEQGLAISRGGYVIRDGDEVPEAIIIATGSEVGLALDAADVLASQDHQIRVVSMPSTDIFDAQEEEYRESVLPAWIRARVVIEAGSSRGWHRYTGGDGDVIGIDSFGESAPGDTVFKHFGFTVDRVVEVVQSIIEKNRAA